MPVYVSGNGNGEADPRVAVPGNVASGGEASERFAEVFVADA
jgi:hypothetical protein